MRELEGSKVLKLYFNTSLKAYSTVKHEMRKKYSFSSIPTPPAEKISAK